MRYALCVSMTHHKIIVQRHDNDINIKSYKIGTLGFFVQFDQLHLDTSGHIGVVRHSV